MAKQENKPRRWLVVASVVLFLMFFGFVISGFISIFFGLDAGTLGGNVALIPVKGVIMVEKATGLFETGASSESIVELIKKADGNPEVKAIIFDINSPGGSAVASDEIARAIKATNKTTVALIREVGASGGYWIASACDHVIANRMSITGSIGVISSYLQFSGTMDDYNVTYERLVSGKYKDMGTPFKELTYEERALFEKKLDVIHDYFIEEVAQNRHLEKKDVAKIAQGEFYLGSEAKELGLVDILGGKEEAVQLLSQKLNMTVEIAEYRQPLSIRDIFAQALSKNSFYLGKGIGSAMFGNKESGLKIIT